MSRRYINGQMVEVADTNTQAVIDKLHRQPADEDALAAELPTATDEQLRLLIDYGKPYAARAAKREADRRQAARNAR